MKIMTLKEVSHRTRVPEATLRYWRSRGTGPKSFKLGGRRVAFLEEDVEAWIQEQYSSAG